MVEVTPEGRSGIVGFDHVALPMQDATAMVAFYRSLDLEVEETPYLVQVSLGTQMINFHRPDFWRGDFDLRAPAAIPPCGDLCFVWQGSLATLRALLHLAGTVMVEGPVPRQGGRGTTGISTYVRDPDGNLLEFIVYEDDEVVPDVR
jgi:catechol 2,3-dioxygenase-like lactoylglutathione lyase family enzyme